MISTGAMGRQAALTKNVASLFLLAISLLCQLQVSPYESAILNHMEAASLMGQFGFAIASLGE